jgi:chromosome partitioning protein
MLSRLGRGVALQWLKARNFFVIHASTSTIFPYNPPEHTEVAMRIIALMNQKGGVGKTTTCVNLGAALAEMGRKICLIDLDPQAHLTINYGIELTPEVVSLYDVLLGEKTFLEAMHRVDDNIALVPSSIDLAAADIELASVAGREIVMRKAIEAAQHDFDYILLDCPPSLGLLTINALSCANEVIIPMQPHFLALQGVAKLLETVQLVNKRMNPKLKVSGIALTMFDSQTKLSNEVVAELNGFIAQAKGKPLPWADAKIFNSKIRRNIKLAESPSFGQTIIAYGPTSNGATDYRSLAKEIDAMGAKAAPSVPAQAAEKPAGTAPVAAPVPSPVAEAPATAPIQPLVPPPAQPLAPAPKVEVTMNPAIQQKPVTSKVAS